MKNQLQVLCSTAISLALSNPSIAVGVSATIFSGWITYNYLPNVLYGTVALGAVSFGNHKLANIAVTEGNSGFYDYVATVSEILNKVSFGYFSQIDSNKVLTGGIDHSNPELVQAAIDHGADVNIEVEGVRPLERAFDLQNDAGNTIAMQLIGNGADLSKAAREANTGNLFHKVLQTGKDGLVEAAIAQAATNPALVESVDANGNNLAHLQAVSPDLRALTHQAGVTMTSEAINAANKAAKTQVHVAMHSYHNDDVDSRFTSKYLEHGTAASTQQYFGEVLATPELRGSALMLANKPGFNPGMQYKNGLLPIDYAVQYGSDEVAMHVADITDPALYTNQHLWQAYQRPNLENTRDLLAKKLLTSPKAEFAFFQNPSGDGQSLASKMILNPKIFDAVVFRHIYTTTKEASGSYKDPIGSETAIGLNWLHSAAMVGNKAAVQTMREIILEEGSVVNHISALTAEGGKCLAALCYHGFLKDVKMLANSDKTLEGIVTVLTKPYIALPAPTEGDGEGVGPLVTLGSTTSVLDVTNVGEGQLIVTDEYVKAEQEFLRKHAELERFKEKQASAREESLRQAMEEEKENGIPQQIKLVPMTKHVVKINQEAAITGGLIKQLTMSKGLVTAISGSDALEGNIPLWTTVFGIGGYLEAYGKCHASPTKEAVIGAAVYGTTSYMMHGDIQDLPGFTPPEERSIGDFLYKYSTYIAASPIANFIMLGASAYTGGYVGGTTGVLQSVGTAAGISTAVSYNIYTNDPTDETKQSTDYLTLDNAIAAVVTSYVGYYAAIGGISAVTALATTASTPIVIAAATTSALYTISKAYSTWGLTKLAIETIPVTAPVKEISSSTTTVASEYGVDILPMINEAYNTFYSAVDTLYEYTNELWNSQEITNDYGFSDKKCYWNSTLEILQGNECSWTDMCPAP